MSETTPVTDDEIRRCLKVANQEAALMRCKVLPVAWKLRAISSVLELLARIADMHSDRAPDDLILWSNNVRQPETVLTLGHARAVRAALTITKTVRL